MRCLISFLLICFMLTSSAFSTDERAPEFKDVGWKPLMFYNLPKDEPAAYRFSFPLSANDVSILNRYPYVDFSYLGKGKCLDNKALQNLGRLEHLVEVCLDDCAYETAQLDHLFSSLKDLSSLDLTKITLTRGILRKIATFNPNLQYLGLTDCQVEADDLTPLLRRLSSLSYLEINNCPFHEEDVIILLGNNPQMSVMQSWECRRLIAEIIQE